MFNFFCESAISSTNEIIPFQINFLKAKIGVDNF
jgi:hypothetical protein